jgi:hypothetical protein
MEVLEIIFLSKMFLLLLVVLFHSAGARLFLLNETFPTVQYFEAQYPLYKHRNVSLIAAIPQRPCTFPSNTTHGAIVFVDTVEAYNKGCKNVYHITTALQPLRPVAIVLASRLRVEGTPGGPFAEKYTVRRWGVADDAPATPTVFLSMADGAVLRTKLPSSARATLVYERGIWNQVFLSKGMQSLKFLLFAGNAAMLSWAIILLIKAWRGKAIKWDQRDAVFMLGVVASVFYLISIPMRFQTQWRSMMHRLASICFNIAFLLLLDLCIKLLSYATCTRPTRWTRLLFMYVAIALALDFGIEVLELVVSRNTITFLWDKVFSGVLVITQIILAVFFLWYALVFSSLQVDKEDAQAYLGRMTAVAALAGLTFLAKPISTSLHFQVWTPGSVFWSTVCILLKHVTMTLRCVALLVVFSVRLSRTEEK